MFVSEAFWEIRSGWWSLRNDNYRLKENSLLFYETRSSYVAQACLKRTILPPQPPKSWDCRCVQPLCFVLKHGRLM